MLQLALASMKSSLRKFFKFSGRTSRAEYWWGILLGGLVLAISAVAFAGLTAFSVIALIPVFLVNLIVTIFSVTLTARRLHDINRSGWWQLVMITGIGIILVLIWVCRKGVVGDNRFGPESTIKESKPAEWIVPFVVYLVVTFASYFMPASEPKFALQTPSASGAPSAPASPVEAVPPSEPVAAPSDSPAAVAPAAAPVATTQPAKDECEQRMYDHAVSNNANPDEYIALNQAYLTECRKVISGSQP